MHVARMPLLPRCQGFGRLFEEHVFSNEVEELFYQQWASTDKCLMQTINSTISQFYKLFVKSILKLKRHAFIAKTQSYFLKELKNDLSTNHALVLLDFAENYSFVV